MNLTLKIECSEFREVVENRLKQINENKRELFSDQLCPYIEEFTTSVIIYIFRKFKFCIFTVRPADIQCENWGPGADLNMQCIPPQLTSFQTEEKKEKRFYVE